MASDFFGETGYFNDAIEFRFGAAETKVVATDISDFTVTIEYDGENTFTFTQNDGYLFCDTTLSYDVGNVQPPYMAFGTQRQGNDYLRGNFSSSFGESLIANSDHQLVLGKYNDESAYPFVIGNGTSDSNRSNALTVDWQGNVVCGTVNGIDIASAITGVAQFQGELDSQATLEAADYEAGWFWVVTRSGTYAGNVCEQGDMVYAVADKGEAYAASDFVVVQANLGPTTNLSNIDIDQICV